MSKTIFIKFFGQLTDVTQINELAMNNVADTDAAIEKVLQQYPLLKNYTYVIALDRKVISGNTIISDSQTIAFMPPFSGG